MLFTHDLTQAREIMEAEGMSWPQVVLTDELIDRFKISGYPTNLLVLPDGTTYVEARAVSESFFERHVK